MEEVYTFYNEEGAAMAEGSLHSERERFQGRKVGTDHVVVVSIEAIFDNGVSLYPDPMEEDNVLCLGQFALYIETAK